MMPAQALDLNLGDYDGIALEVEGDGQTYKLNLKTADQEDVPECTFQATFDTTAGARVLTHGSMARSFGSCTISTSSLAESEP